MSEPIDVGTPGTDFIRQIVATALRKLRHPSRSTRLKDFLE